MTEPTDPYGRPDGAFLPAPVDPYPQASYPQSYPQTYHQTYQQGVNPQYQQAQYAPAGYPHHDPVTGAPYSEKSRVVAGVLSIVLGAFGAGRFYTGHVGIAIAQIAVTWLTCGIGHIWPLIDGIIVLAQGGTDAQGRVLRP